MELAQKFISLYKHPEEEMTPDGRNPKEWQIAVIDRQLDQFIYDLYAFSAEGRALVENQVGKSESATPPYLAAS